MSAVVIDADLVAEIRQMIHERALQFPKSVAANILPDRFEETVLGVATGINLEFPDRDTALWAALGAWKHKNPHCFIRNRFKKHAISLMESHWLK